MRCNRFLLISLVLGVLLLGSISASFTLGNPAYNIDDEYELGDKINGWINMSFTDETYNTTFTDSFGNTFELQTVINTNPSYVHTINNSLINAEYQILLLNDLFTIPSIFGELEYELNFSDSVLFLETINLNSSTQQNLTLKVEAARAINNKKNDLKNFKTISQTHTGIIKQKLDGEFNVLNLEDQIALLELNYTYASSDAQYQEIIDEINSMKVPKLILESNSIDNINFYPQKEVIDFSVLTGITNEAFSEANTASYANALFIWSQDSIDTRVNYKEFSVSYGTYEEVLFNYFEVQFLRKPDINTYLIIEDLNDLEFDENYNQGNTGNYIYLNLRDLNYKDIIFITTEDVDFTTLPMFISPALEDLPTTGDVIIDSRTEMKISKWIFFGLIVLFLLVVGLVIYSIVSSWYDRKYENHLFPNRNNLYNLIIFVNNSKRKGVGNDEIVKSLKKSKWSSEQIRYVMKKYAGKRTGMAKLPFKKTQKIPKPVKTQPKTNPGPMRGPTRGPRPR
jgi:hypothetical protein